jgi:hypothetical protein
MRTYVFFNGRTGEILHTHRVQTLTGDSLSVSREELLSGDAVRLLEGRIDMADLDVLDVDENSHLVRRTSSQEDKIELFVDVEKRILSEREKG